MTTIYSEEEFKKLLDNECTIEGYEFKYFNVKNVNIKDQSFRFCKFYCVDFLDCKFFNVIFDCCSFTGTQIHFENGYLAGYIWFMYCRLEGLYAFPDKKVGCNIHMRNSSEDYTHFSEEFISSIVPEDLKTECPLTGSFTAWKKCWNDDMTDTVLVKLLIPEDADRCYCHSDSDNEHKKCRASKAEVLGIYSLDGREMNTQVAVSDWNFKFIYRVGETVECEEPFCSRRSIVCASGIHFFMTQEQARNYVL